MTHSSQEPFRAQAAGLRAELARSDFASEQLALQREWLVTNGIGGFASGTVSQANTRRYHGLLVASLRPPVERIVTVAKLDATVYYQGRRYELACNEYADGTISPRGFAKLSAFRLENGLPIWTYAAGDALLEQRIWMANGRNTTYVSFTLLAATGSMELEIVPLCTYRDYHAHAHGSWNVEVVPEEHGCRILAFPGARTYRLWVDQGRFEEQRDWYWGFRHRVEAERGLDPLEDLFRPGLIRARLSPRETVTCVLTTEAATAELPATCLDREIRRRQRLLDAAPSNTPDWIRQLILAADQFIVRRSGREGDPDGTSVIAGYPWFSDWGRDTMIALPGLTLPTQRSAEAASILRTFAGHVSQGMLPNRFPDAGETPEYNTVDATLWYFHAIAAYLEETEDQTLLRELYPVLKDIIDWHRRGTRYSIHVDPADGLLYAGEPGAQLTWMDAKIGDWVVTPRTGKAVEINALWHYALRQMSRWALAQNDSQAATDYDTAATRVADAFGDAFWFAPGGYLYDVIDSPDGEMDSRGRRVDTSLRPNQIVAVTLGTNLLDLARARSVVDTCARELLTPVGLRSLTENDTRYIGVYGGGPRERDAAYHQGTVWSWLLGPFALAHYRVYGDPEHALALLSGIAPHLSEGCLDTVSEIFDGNAPHTPRGCFAQAWGVSETLRAWHTLTRARRPARLNLVQMVGG